MTVPVFGSGVLLLLAVNAGAQALVDTEKSPWAGRGELGLIVASGNSDAQSLNAKLDLRWEGEDWNWDFATAGLRARNRGLVSAERLETRVQAAHEFAQDGYWFTGLKYSDDRFNGFEYQASASTGYRHEFIDREGTLLTAQIGTGYRRLENALTGETVSDVIGQGDVNFEHGLTDTTRFVNRFTSEAGGQQTLLENKAALEVKITTTLALSIGATVRFNSDPPAELEKTDTLTTVNLVYGFGTS